MARKIAGIEEAGRGPLIGPLVIAIAIIDESKVDELKKINVKDSKKLTPRQREEIFEKLRGMLLYKTKIIYPKEIDLELKNELSNLNLLEAKKMAELINETNANNVIIDCPSNNIKKFVNDVRKFLNENKKNTKILAEHKADENYLIVSAASIIAKVTRDKEIEKIKEITQEDFGSGYPSDPRTIEFMKKYYKDYPQFFRKTWITYKRFIDLKKQKRINEFFS